MVGMAASASSSKPKIFVQDGVALRIHVPVCEEAASLIPKVREHGGVISKHPNHADILIQPSKADIRKLNYEVMIKTINKNWFGD